MYLNLHIIQNFPASNLNRDDTGAPKECKFGGYRRSRISSQCLKRSIRTHGAFNDEVRSGGGDLGVRTKRLIDELVSIFAQNGKPEGEGPVMAEAVVSALGLKKAKNSEKTEYLLYLGCEEIEELAAVALANWETVMGDKKHEFGKEEAKKIGDILTQRKKNGGYAADIALFGRMVADDKYMNVDAACQVAHAFSTHKAGMETDYYTAVDDLLPEGESGSDMIGVIEYASACFYKYANVNIEQLKANLGGNADLLQAALKGFVRSSIESIPSGKQNSFAAHTPPCYIEVTLSDAPVSYANAFSRPVAPFGEVSIEEASIKSLMEHSSKNEAFLGTAPRWRSTANYFGNGLSVPALLADLDGQLKAL